MFRSYSLKLVCGLVVAAWCGLLLVSCSKNSNNPAGPGGGTGGTITVTGKVIGTNKQPQSGVPIIVVGTTIPSVNTDANGSFTIANVTTPYTIAVVDAANKQSLIYRGLTRSDPTLVWLNLAIGTQHSASLTGNIFPSGNYPEPSGTRSRVAFGSPEGASSSGVNATTGAYSVSVGWYGPTTTTGTLYALQWTYNTSTSLPTGYNGYGARSGIALLDATTNPNGNDTMSAVSTATLAGNVTVASGYTLAQKSLSVIFANNAAISLFTDASAAAAFSYTTPSITGATMYLTAIATKAPNVSYAFKVGLAPGASGVAVTLPPSPELSLPIDATTGVTNHSLFSWTSVPNSVHLLVLNPGGGSPRYIVLTTAAADSIPNMSTAGLGLPTSVSYSWQVYAFGPFANADAAAGPAGFLGGYVGVAASDAFTSWSGMRTFTTAP